MPETTARGFLSLPTLVAHCDWGLRPEKRWVARATLQDGVYFALRPEPVGELATAVERWRKDAGSSGPILLGFDFPVGLPMAYAAKANVAHFPSFLRGLKADSAFFEVCKEPGEISLDRPFYPQTPGGRQRTHLETGLGIEFAQMLRRCDRGHHGRVAAGALFWTLGAKQVGKGALVGLRDVLIPGLRAGEIKLWPFDGALRSLLQSDCVVVAETYPTEYQPTIFRALQGSKTNQAVRAEAGLRILGWAADRPQFVHVTPVLEGEIRRGFDQGDDAFDAVIGLLGMIDALRNWGLRCEPTDAAIRDVEGWIFGQPVEE